MSDRIKAERTFIHDISSPLATSMMLLASVLDDLAEGQPLTAKKLEQLKKLHTNLERMNVLLQQRRTVLVEEQA